jgi:hypothetical protein
VTTDRIEWRAARRVCPLCLAWEGRLSGVVFYEGLAAYYRRRTATARQRLRERCACPTCEKDLSGWLVIAPARQGDVKCFVVLAEARVNAPSAAFDEPATVDEWAESCLDLARFKPGAGLSRAVDLAANVASREMFRAARVKEREAERRALAKRREAKRLRRSENREHARSMARLKADLATRRRARREAGLHHRGLGISVAPHTSREAAA